MLDLTQLNKQIQTLDKGNDASRRLAIQSLRTHEPREWDEAPRDVVRTLIISLQQQLQSEVKPPFIHKDVASILGNVGPRSKSAVPQLVHLLREGVPDAVRESAATALGRVGAEARDAVEHLLPLLQERNGLALQAVRALGDIGCVTPRVRTALAQVWQSPFPSPNGQIQSALALSKLKIQADGVLPFLTGNLLASPDHALRRAAAQALAWRTPQELDVVPALLSAALADKHDEVRLIAQASLDELGLPQDKAISVCAKQLKDSVHAEAALRKAGPLAVPALIKALRSDDEATRIKAARILSLLGEAAAPAVPVLTAALRDKAGDVRLSAAKSLWNITKQADLVVPVLIKVLEEERAVRYEDGEVRRRRLQTIIEALWRVGPPAQAAVPALNIMAKDKNRLVSESAQQALKSILPTAPAK